MKLTLFVIPEVYYVQKLFYDNCNKYLYRYLLEATKEAEKYLTKYEPEKG